MHLASFYDRITRRKEILAIDTSNQQTSLSRCLSLIDLIALGVGTTLGAGAYVLSGQVAKRDAGPAVVLSFFIAAAASVLAALCYAEFGARVPKAGSAYVYTYVTIGEIIAFTIGWNLILEYIIGAATVARTASGYVDDLIGDKLINWFMKHLPMENYILAPYADLMAFGIVMIMTFTIAIGVKESATVTKIFTGLNVIILSYAILAGFFIDDMQNWKITPNDIPINDTCGHSDNVTGCGTGGFAPYGFTGIIKGAATCFFAFIGFDSIASTGEEAKNPQRNIPMATMISLFIVFCFYFGVSLTITMITPYYALDMRAPFAKAFETIGWSISRYVISVGAIIALTASLLGGMFPMPRIIMAMARDGLLFRFFGHIEKHVKTPVIATLTAGLIAAILAAMFDVDALVEMMSIGTLLAYTLVAISVLVLRYECDKDSLDSAMHSTTDKAILAKRLKLWSKESLKSLYSITAKRLIGFLVISLVCMCFLLHFGSSQIFQFREWWAIFAFATLVLLISMLLLLISRQPQNTTTLKFTMPYVPLLPAISIFINLYLMVNLSTLTWIRFAIWMIIGFIIYFGYGIRHSSKMNELEKHDMHDLTSRSSLCSISGNLET